MDEDVVVATAMVFIMAGYDTTATLLSYGSYALAKNPEVQKRLQEEVDEAFAEAEGDFPEYSAVQELPYLDMVVHETLRLPPNLQLLPDFPTSQRVLWLD